ncbi:MAG TPA: type I-C CRISPR-associated protein Cas5c [Rectinema sp.]|jgi:CRISPR-associated protein Cas5d|nr:type I-C CRISPR-associated protein Cas5c [Rectinema sp.]HPN03440.1 type I-C CRISPR-associated protein Cas5c [Rectinema sp.]
MADSDTHGDPYTIEVWGEFACFTSPMKVERWSYPFITPSAARGIFDAIFVNRHEFRWQIDAIELLSEPRYIALRRNEVKEKGPNEREINEWMVDISKLRPLFADAAGDVIQDPLPNAPSSVYRKWSNTADATKGRTQRQTMALRDVRYRLTAHIVPWPNAPKNIKAYREQFERRLERGQNFAQPCLGCREFPAWWGSKLSDKKRWEGNIDAGWMLYDVFDLSRPGESTDSALISVFRGIVKDGIVKVPPYESELVKKGVNA